MIKTGDRLVCISGNEFYSKGQSYAVGEFINCKYFELYTDNDSECWYATIDDTGISVGFDSIDKDYSTALFSVMNHESESWLEVYENSADA